MTGTTKNSRHRTLCSRFNTMADEITSAETAVGHSYYDRKEAVRALGRVRYAIWVEDAHKQDLTLAQCFYVAFFYSVEMACDALSYVLSVPLNVIVCKRR